MISRTARAILAVSAAMVAAGLPGVSTRRVAIAAAPPPAMTVSPAAGSQELSHTRLPMAFIRNQGQWDSSIRFLVQHGRGRAWLTDAGFVTQLVRHHRNEVRHRDPLDEDEGWYEGVNVAFTFEGANPSPVITAQGELPGRYHFFIDHDPSAWRTDVRSYARVTYREVYPGIDVEFYESDGNLEYDLVVRAGADPSVVVLRCTGAEDVALAADGSLRVKTGLGEVLHTAPVVGPTDELAGAEPPGCQMVALDDERIAFQVNGWDGHGELRIDPVLVFGTYLGGLGTGDILLNIAVDSSRQPVVVGKTASGFPTTPGAFQETYAGGLGDAFVTKLSADGGSLEFSTYIGTSNASEGAGGLALAPSGDLIVSGNTSSALFPVTPGAYDETANGGNDTWVLRLRADGAALVFSTLLGGSQSDTGAVIALSSTEEVFLTARTGSPDFPTTEGALSTSLLSDTDAYIARLSADGSDLVFATFSGATGGSNQNVGPAGIQMGGDGSVYVAGRVSGVGLPVTPGAYQPSHHGEMDGFVLKLDASGSFLHYCTYFGGTRWEDARDIHVDDAGSAYIMGMTDSFDLPDTPGAYSPTLLGSDSAYVVKFSPDGSALEYCTYAGGNCFNDPHALTVDASGHAYVGGHTCPSFPTTPDAIKHGTSGSPNDGFLLKLDPTGSSLLYATLIGGDVGNFTPSETVRALALDDQGGLYLAGETYSTDFPTTPGAFDTEMAGNEDGFVAKIDFSPWMSVGHALAGTSGLEPVLGGTGLLEPGSPGSIELTHAKALAQAYLIVGLAHLDAPFKGGTMIPSPLLLIPVTTNAVGGNLLSWATWPGGLPVGLELLMQYWILDPGGFWGFSASNGLSAVIPAGS